MQKRNNHKILLGGLASGMLLLSIQKILELLVIINFLTTIIIALSFFFLALGFLKPGLPSKMRRFDQSALIFIIVLLAIGSQYNRDFTSMAFASAIYYPVPLPKSSLWNLISLFSFLFLPVITQYIIGKKVGHHIQNTTSKITAFSFFLTGLVTGSVVIYLFSYFSPYLWMALSLVLLVFFIFNKTMAIILATIALSIALFFHYLPQRTFFLFGVQNYTYLGGKFGRDVKVDFISFNKDRCLGMVVNNMMSHIECDQISGYKTSEFDFFIRSLINPIHLPSPQIKIENMRAGRKDIPVNPVSDFSTLQIGRSSGSLMSLLEIYTGKNNNTAVEFDPAIRDLWLKYDLHYSSGMFRQGKGLVLTGDYITNLKKLKADKKKFDFIHLHGIGTKIYQLARSYIFDEHFLLTQEGLDIIFNNLLKPNGLFLLDWGSSSYDEARWFIASFPVQVEKLILWTTGSEYPFAGNPLLLIVASKNQHKIKQIGYRMSQMPAWLQINAKSLNDGNYKTSENKPFLQNDMYYMIIGVHILLLLILTYPILRIKKHITEPRLPINIISILLLGSSTGLLDGLISSFNASIILPYNLNSWLVMHSIYLLAMPLGYILLPKISLAFKVISVTLLIFFGFVMIYFLRENYFILLSPLFIGFSIGHILRLLLKEYSLLTRQISMFFLSMSLGLILVIMLSFILGYYLTIGFSLALTFISLILYTFHTYQSKSN